MLKILLKKTPIYIDVFQTSPSTTVIGSKSSVASAPRKLRRNAPTSNHSLPHTIPPGLTNEPPHPTARHPVGKHAGRQAGSLTRSPRTRTRPHEGGGIRDKRDPLSRLPKIVRPTCPLWSSHRGQRSLPPGVPPS